MVIMTWLTPSIPILENAYHISPVCNVDFICLSQEEVGQGFPLKNFNKIKESI